jgi:DNA-binding CsgD family transcriptional regulator
MLSESDAIQVQRLRDLLDCYRPSARPVVDELIHGLRETLEADGAVTFRPVRGELGWSADFLYCTEPFAVDVVHQFLKTAPDRWSPFFPVTPARLRNRAVRPRVIHGGRVVRPTHAAREFIKLVDRMPRYGMTKDDLGISVCDGPLVLAWVGATRDAPFGEREIELVDAIASSLRARMLLEHQLSHAKASRALLEAALEAIPTATFIVTGPTIAHANATGRALLDKDRTWVVDRLRESLGRGSADAPFTLTPVESPGVPVMTLAVLRGGDSIDRVSRQLRLFSAKRGLSKRQAQVMALLARGHANKTIAERIGLAESTVEEHVTRLFEKAAVGCRAELVAAFWMDSP